MCEHAYKKNIIPNLQLAYNTQNLMDDSDFGIFEFETIIEYLPMNNNANKSFSLYNLFVS